MTDRENDLYRTEIDKIRTKARDAHH